MLRSVKLVQIFTLQVYTGSILLINIKHPNNKSELKCSNKTHYNTKEAHKVCADRFIFLDFRLYNFLVISIPIKIKN